MIYIKNDTFYYGYYNINVILTSFLLANCSALNAIIINRASALYFCGAIL